MSFIIKAIKFSNTLRRVFNWIHSRWRSPPIKYLWNISANQRARLITQKYGKTASKKINLSSISCCVLCDGETAHLVYKNHTSQFQHQEKPFECRNCPRGYFLRKVFEPLSKSYSALDDKNFKFFDFFVENSGKPIKRNKTDWDLQGYKTWIRTIRML